MTNSIGAQAQNTQAQNVSHKTFIQVTDDGMFALDGKLLDIISLVFQVQRDTGKIAQERLAFTAKELWDANRQSKMVVFFLNGLRAIRPAGAADARVEAEDITEQAMKFKNLYGEDPFTKLGIGDMKPDPLYKVHNWAKNKDGNRSEDSLRSHYHPKSEAQMKIVTDLSLGESTFWIKGTSVTKMYDAVKQAELDQMIEGVKSQLSAINSKQQLMQTDTERYSHMADETKEHMASIEKTIANAIQATANKI